MKKDFQNHFFESKIKKLANWLRSSPLMRLAVYRAFVNLLNRLYLVLSPRITRLVQYNPRPLHLSRHDDKTLHLDKSSLPLITIVTPSLNQGAFIERTINSVVTQKYSNLQYSIQDGGSSDDTIEVISKFLHHGLNVEVAKDSGQADALNRGFRQSSGEIMAYLNSDDLLLPGTLHYVAHYFSSHPEVDIIYSHRIIIDEHDQEIGRWVLPPHSNKMLLWHDYVPQETMFWRRKVWEMAGGFFDESFKFALDWELLIRFWETGARFARLPRFLAAFRIHKSQKTLAKMEEIGLKEMERIRTRVHDRTVTNAEIFYNIWPYQYKSLLYHFLYRLGLLKY